MNRSTQNSAPTKAWPPGELDNYDPQYFETYGQESRADLKRFGVLARCLAGGGDTTQFVEVDNRWSVNPALRDLKPMVLGLARGGHIVDVGAGRGEPAAGMLLELEASGITSTRYLTTDLGDYSAFPDTVDGLAYELAKYPPGRRIYIDPPEDYYKPWTDTYIDQSKWGGLRERVIRRYGDDWDATEPGIFDRAQEALGGERIGLLLLRHPQISDYPEVFAKIVANLMGEAVRTGTPVLITTSTNPTSRERIQAAINAFWETTDPGIRARWKTVPWGTPSVMHKNASMDGSRIIDTKAWAIFPQPS